MVKWFIISVVILFVVLAVRCTAGRVSRNNRNIEQICFAELGDGVVKNSSPDSTYVMCWKEVEANPNNPVSYFEYIVIKRDLLKVVYRGKARSGKVIWYSDEELLITEKLGILGQKSENIRTYKINIRTNQITNIDRIENL